MSNHGAAYLPTKKLRIIAEQMGDTGLEPATPCMSSRYSNQLS